jgi:hypothetical protein
MNLGPGKSFVLGPLLECTVLSGTRRQAFVDVTLAVGISS